MDTASRDAIAEAWNAANDIWFDLDVLAVMLGDLADELDDAVSATDYRLRRLYFLQRYLEQQSRLAATIVSRLDGVLGLQRPPQAAAD